MRRYRSGLTELEEAGIEAALRKLRASAERRGVDLDDLRQAAAIRIWQSRGSNPPEYSAKVARWAMVDYLRHDRVQQPWHAPIEEREDEENPLSTVADAGADPVSDAQLAQAIARLTPAMRETVEAVLATETFTEAGAKLGMTGSAIYHRLVQVARVLAPAADGVPAFVDRRRGSARQSAADALEAAERRYADRQE